jgi:hypothetical protein
MPRKGFNMPTYITEEKELIYNNLKQSGCEKACHAAGCSYNTTGKCRVYSSGTCLYSGIATQGARLHKIETECKTNPLLKALIDAQDARKKREAEYAEALDYASEISDMIEEGK